MADQITNNNHKSRTPSIQSSFSSAKTIIEVEQHPHEHVITTQDNPLTDHEHRLRLIESNRSQLHIHQDPLPSPHHSPSLPSLALPPKNYSSLKIHLLLSPTNQKFLIDFNLASDVYHLKLNLFQNWPSDWARKGTVCPNQLSQIRLIYMGRVLSDQDLLNSLGSHQEITIHLVIKPDDQVVEEESKEVPLLSKLLKNYCCCFCVSNHEN